MAQAADTIRPFIELGGAIIGLAILARIANYRGFPAILGRQDGSARQRDSNVVRSHQLHPGNADLYTGFQSEETVQL